VSVADVSLRVLAQLFGGEAPLLTQAVLGCPVAQSFSTEPDLPYCLVTVETSETTGTLRVVVVSKQDGDDEALAILDRAQPVLRDRRLVADGDAVVECRTPSTDVVVRGNDTGIWREAVQVWRLLIRRTDPFYP